MLPLTLYFLLFNQVMQSLRFALQPTVSDVSVKWDLPKKVTATPLSPPITVIFQGQRLLTYYQLTGKVGTLLLRAVLLHFRPPVCLSTNSHCGVSSDFTRRKWLCDGGVQVARWSLFRPPPVWSQASRGFWVKNRTTQFRLNVFLCAGWVLLLHWLLFNSLVVVQVLRATQKYLTLHKS